MIAFLENEEKLSDSDLSLVINTLDRIESEFNIIRPYSISFINDEEIKKLNSEYRGLDNPTDILTFALDDGLEPFYILDEEEELGSIYISLESMEKNAEYFSVKREDELKRLLLHGILHLLGYDHKTNEFSSEPMLILQEKILKTL